jgi:hypothetical protein
VRRDPCSLDAEAIEHTQEIIGHVRLWITASSCVAPTGVSPIRREHSISVGGQRADQPVPLPPILREAVNEHDRRTIAGPASATWLVTLPDVLM